MTQWKERRPGEHVFKAGPIQVVVDNQRADGAECCVRVYVGDPLYEATVREGLDTANVHLREIHIALREHFAPVLRWTRGDDGDYTAVIEGWELSARDCNWSLVHSSGARLLSPRPNQADAATNRSAAAAALRAMGVIFRLEESTL
jgi:hypothetical protein